MPQPREPLIALFTAALAAVFLAGQWWGRRRAEEELAERARANLPRWIGHELYYLVPLPEYREWQRVKARGPLA